MFELPNPPGPVRSDLRATLRDLWAWFASAGTWWDAIDRLAIAETTRAARLHVAVPESGLPTAAVTAATLLGGQPAITTQAWVDEQVQALGEEAYAELLGIASMTVAVDTFTRLMGSQPEPFPNAQDGQPSREALAKKPRKGKTWIAMTPMPVPPYVLSIVPDAMVRGNAVEHAFYMTGQDMGDSDFSRGELHRTQIEFVASSLSWANECFY